MNKHHVKRNRTLMGMAAVLLLSFGAPRAALAQCVCTDPIADAESVAIEVNTAEMEGVMTGWYGAWQTWSALIQNETLQIAQNTAQIELSLASTRAGTDQATVQHKMDTQAALTATQQQQQQVVAAQGIQRSVEQFNQGTEQNFCQVASNRQSVGASRAVAGAGHWQVAAATSSYPSSFTDRSAAINQFTTTPPTALQPDYVGMPVAGTLSLMPRANPNAATGAPSQPGVTQTSQLEDQLKFVTLTLAPVPPIDPKNLPAQFKSQASARLYANTWQMWKSSFDLASKAPLRQIEMQMPTVQVTPDMLTKWQAVTQGNPQSNLADATPGQPSFPNQYAGLTPAACYTGASLENSSAPGGGGCISELDYIRTELFERYGNPDWGAKYLNTMNDSAVLKELATIEVMNGRMLYEIMANSSALASLESFRYSHENNQQYGPTLTDIATQMRKNNAGT